MLISLFRYNEPKYPIYLQNGGTNVKLPLISWFFIMAFIHGSGHTLQRQRMRVIFKKRADFSMLKVRDFLGFLNKILF